MKNHALIIQRDVICIYILLTYAVVQQKLIQQCKATILKKKKKSLGVVKVQSRLEYYLNTVIL